MIRDIKLGFKVMKYGLNAMYFAFAMGISLVASIMFGLLVPVGLSGIYLGMATMLVAQLIFSVSVSTMVQTSSLKKKLQTTIPTLLSGMFLVVGNTISLGVTWIWYKRSENNRNPFVSITMESGEMETGILLTCGLMIFITFYVFLSMKQFWLGTFLFIGGFFGGYYFFKQEEINYLIMPTWIAVFLSYGMIVLGCLIMYGISCATYKKEFSKQSFETMLKRASK